MELICFYAIVNYWWWLHRQRSWSPMKRTIIKFFTSCNPPGVKLSKQISLRLKYLKFQTSCLSYNINKLERREKFKVKRRRPSNSLSRLFKISTTWQTTARRRDKNCKDCQWKTIMLRLSTTNWNGSTSYWLSGERKKSVMRRHYSKLSKRRVNAATKITKEKINRMSIPPTKCKNPNHSTHWKAHPINSQ